MPQEHGNQASQVCLIRPPTVTSVSAVGLDAIPPIGLAYIAGTLRDAGYSVNVIDGCGEAVKQYTVVHDKVEYLIHGLKTSEIVDRIPEDVEVIGFSCMFTVEWPISKEILLAIHKKFPSALVVAGGEHITSSPEFVMDDCPPVDVCVLGEGEETINELVEAYYSKKPFSEVAGICFRDGEKYTRTSTRKRIKQISEIPWPAWDLFPVTEYIDNGLTQGINLGRSIPILASRGCPYACTFCSSVFMWTQRWNVRDPEDVIAEIKKYMKEYAVTNFDFADLTAIIKKEWVVRFATMLIEQNLNITWQLPSGTRSEVLDNEVTTLMYRSGCRSLNYAPESGSKEELIRIKKRVKLDRMLDSMKGAKASGLEIKANLIFGMPGQTWKDVRHTFKFIVQLAWVGVDAIGSFAYSPYPGSELFKQLQDEGRIDLDAKYFNDLLGYSDPLHTTVSYNPKFSPKMLSFLCFTSMSMFWGLSFVFRPKRAFVLFYQLLTRDNSSKLAYILSNKLRKKSAKKMAEQSGDQTVVINDMFKPVAQKQANAGRG